MRRARLGSHREALSIRRTDVREKNEKRTNKKKMRKQAIWIVPTLILGAVFSSYAGGTDASAPEAYEYSIASWNQQWRDENINLSKLWMDEHYGVTFNWVSTENQFEKLNVLMAAGDIPDILAMRMDVGRLTTYADQGVLGEIPMSMIREHMPDYVSLIDGFGDSRVWSYGEVDGRNMGLPIIAPSDFFRQGIAWNAQWLLNVGITSIPQTIDEFEAAFLKFRNEDPDQDGAKDTYAFSAPGAHEFAPEWGSQKKDFFEEIFGAFGSFPFEWVEKDGALVYGFTDPGTKEALALLADWYAQEIIDPEWVTEIPREVGVNDVAWKFANERNGYIAIYGGDDYEWDGGGHVNGKWHNAHPEHRKYFLKDASCWPECAGQYKYDVVAFTEIDPQRFAGEYHPYVNGEPPIGPRGDRGMMVKGTSPQYIAFGRQLADDEPRFTRLLEIYNEIATDRKRYYQAALGCFVDAPEATEACADWPVFEWVPFDSEFGDKFTNTDAWMTDSNKARREELGGNAAGGFSTNPWWVFATWYNVSRGESGQQRNLLYETHMTSNTVERALKVGLPSEAEYADVDKVLKEFFYKAILGTQSVDDWDTVVAKWRRNGGDVLTREANAWFDSVK